MARVLKVSRSGYHTWKLRPTEPEKDALIKVEVAAMFDKSKKTYGSRPMTTALNNKSIPVSEKKIRRIMKESNLHAKATKRFRVTTLSDHNLPVAKNILNREFNALGPNQKWVQDITYIYTQEGWLYLAIVLDLFARCIVRWSMDVRMGMELVIEAFRTAVWNRNPSPGAIAHSDQGMLIPAMRVTLRQNFQLPISFKELKSP